MKRAVDKDRGTARARLNLPVANCGQDRLRPNDAKDVVVHWVSPATSWRAWHIGFDNPRSAGRVGVLGPVCAVGCSAFLWERGH